MLTLAFDCVLFLFWFGIQWILELISGDPLYARISEQYLWVIWILEYGTLIPFLSFFIKDALIILVHFFNVATYPVGLPTEHDPKEVLSIFAIRVVVFLTWTGVLLTNLLVVIVLLEAFGSLLASLGSILLLSTAGGWAVILLRNTVSWEWSGYDRKVWEFVASPGASYRDLREYVNSFYRYTKGFYTDHKQREILRDLRRRLDNQERHIGLINQAQSQIEDQTDEMVGLVQQVAILSGRVNTLLGYLVYAQNASESVQRSINMALQERNSIGRVPPEEFDATSHSVDEFYRAYRQLIKSLRDLTNTHEQYQERGSDLQERFQTQVTALNRSAESLRSEANEFDRKLEEAQVALTDDESAKMTAMVREFHALDQAQIEGMNTLEQVENRFIENTGRFTTSMNDLSGQMTDFYERFRPLEHWLRNSAEVHLVCVDGRDRRIWVEKTQW